MSNSDNIIHTKPWFDTCFGDTREPLPADIRSMSIEVCKQFRIKGVCDPLYIANVAAVELDRGDGRGQFYPPRSERTDDHAARLDKLANRLSSVYPSMQGKAGAVRPLLAQVS